ncbi:hypothetical protein KIPB_010542, partial [Kipferlia bialata]
LARFAVAMALPPSMGLVLARRTPCPVVAFCTAALAHSLSLSMGTHAIGGQTNQLHRALDWVYVPDSELEAASSTLDMDTETHQSAASELTGARIAAVSLILRTLILQLNGAPPPFHPPVCAAIEYVATRPLPHIGAGSPLASLHYEATCLQTCALALVGSGNNAQGASRASRRFTPISRQSEADAEAERVARSEHGLSMVLDGALTPHTTHGTGESIDTASRVERLICAYGTEESARGRELHTVRVYITQQLTTAVIGHALDVASVEVEERQGERRDLLERLTDLLTRGREGVLEAMDSSLRRSLGQLAVLVSFERDH